MFRTIDSSFVLRVFWARQFCHTGAVSERNLDIQKVATGIEMTKIWTGAALKFDNKASLIQLATAVGIDLEFCVNSGW